MGTISLTPGKGAISDVVSDENVPQGEVELQAQVICESQNPGGPATVRLYIDGKQVAVGRLDKQVPQRFGVESLDVGMDALSELNKAFEHKLPLNSPARSAPLSSILTVVQQSPHRRRDSDCRSV
ncbi:MAG: hypothetical protein ABFD49_11705 [Armatimonadota bacterium]|nr:hypothetical protein [bacterium]